MIDIEWLRALAWMAGSAALTYPVVLAWLRQIERDERKGGQR